MAEGRLRKWLLFLPWKSPRKPELDLREMSITGASLFLCDIRWKSLWVSLIRDWAVGISKEKEFPAMLKLGGCRRWMSSGILKGCLYFCLYLALQFQKQNSHTAQHPCVAVPFSGWKGTCFHLSWTWGLSLNPSPTAYHGGWKPWMPIFSWLVSWKACSQSLSHWERKSVF